MLNTDVNIYITNYTNVFHSYIHTYKAETDMYYIHIDSYIHRHRTTHTY